MLLSEKKEKYINYIGTFHFSFKKNIEVNIYKYTLIYVL